MNDPSATDDGYASRDLSTMSALRRRGFLAGAAGLAGAAVLPWTTAAEAAAAVPATATALRVVTGGRARATVLWWGEGSARFAATELRDYVQRITGVRLPLRAAHAPGTTVPEGITGLVSLAPGTGGQTTIPASRLADAGRELSGSPRTPSPCSATTPTCS